MKTYKEFAKLFEAVKFRSGWRTAFENAFSLRNEVTKKNQLKKLMREMKKDLLPQKMIQYIESMLNEWTQTSDPEKQKRIESTILNTLYIPKK